MQAKPKQTPTTYRILEVLLGVIVLTIPILGSRASLFFISIGGILYGLAMLAVGALGLVSAFFVVQSLSKKINVTTSVVTIGLAVVILYFEVIALTSQLLHYLFGIGLLSYAVGHIALGFLSHTVNLGLRTLAIVSGSVVGVLSIIVTAFPLVLIQAGSPQIYLTYSYFLSIALIVIGIDSLALAIIRAKTRSASLESED